VIGQKKISPVHEQAVTIIGIRAGACAASDCQACRRPEHATEE